MKLTVYSYRSAFAGSQRYAAIWTGDNTAEWGHLEASIPMCLSLSVAGMAFCGADIGGFFGNPDGELFVRWYQAAAFQPFFRSHAHIDTKRREPWLYSAGEMSLIRAAVRSRYTLLPLWYTLFYEAEQDGVPPMRPLWYEFPGDELSHAREGTHMVGDSLLVAPVLHKGATSVEVYFPGNTLWYDYWTREKMEVTGVKTISAPYEKVPVFQRGGSIIPIRERVRRSSALMHEDPITLIVAPDKAGMASGSLYLDDGKSFDYQNGDKIYMKFTYDNGKLESKILTPKGKVNSYCKVLVMKVFYLRWVHHRGVAVQGAGARSGREVSLYWRPGLAQCVGGGPGQPHHDLQSQGGDGDGAEARGQPRRGLEHRPVMSVIIHSATDSLDWTQ